MRYLAPIVLLLLLGMSPAGEELFDRDPEHAWNRLHSHLHTRTTADGQRYNQEGLEPVFVARSQFLTEGPSYTQALALLDQFLKKHQETLIRDPLKRAVLQRDLWAIFEKTAERELKRQSHQRELQKRLVQVMRRVALTPGEINQLPDNLTAAVKSNTFSKSYDALHPDRPFLPADLLDAAGPWVMLGDRWGWKGNSLAAPRHAEAVNGRSVFLIFLRLPKGREATIEYLKALEKVELRRDDFPQFPTGTQVALLRRMMLVDREGELKLTPMTESLQIRVYEDLKAPSMYEFNLRRKALFEAPNSSLQAVGDDEINYFDIGTLSGNGPDPFEDPTRNDDPKPVVMKSCIKCHAGPGIYGLQSMFQDLYSHAAMCAPDDLDDQVHSTIGHAHQTYAWGLLQGLWAAGSSP